MNKWFYAFSNFVVVLLVGCSSNDRGTAQGYIEGLLTYISSSTSGYLDDLDVEKGRQVSAGNFLFKLNPQPENHAYEAALTDLQQEKANKQDILAKLQFAEQTLTRNKALYAKRVLQKSALDQAQADRDALVAQIAQSDALIRGKDAQLASSAWILSQKEVKAPKKGVIYDVYFRTGEYVDTNQPVLSILSPNDIKIIFYVEQPMLSALRLGGAIKAACDGCEWVQGKISFISPQAEYTPPLIFSNDTNSKLVYRIEAVFDKNKNISLHPGQPVTVKYDLNG